MANVKIAALATVSAAALLLTACGDNGSDNGSGGEGGEASSTLERLREEGSITVAIAGEIPYSYEDENGELTGASIALDREIYAALGIEEVDAQLVDWDALIPGLNRGSYDSVSAGMSILPERCERGAFSHPNLMYTTALLVPAGNPEGLVDLSSFEDSDATLAVQSGAIEQGYADDMGLSNTMTVNSSTDGMDAVSSGRADAFALTAITMSALADQSDGLEATDAFIAEVDGVAQISAGGTVFRPEDTDLLEAYNAELEKITSDPERFESIVGEFGFTDAERPPTGLTTEMLCSGDLEAANEAFQADN